MPSDGSACAAPNDQQFAQRDSPIPRNDVPALDRCLAKPPSRIQSALALAHRQAGFVGLREPPNRIDERIFICGGFRAPGVIATVGFESPRPRRSRLRRVPRSEVVRQLPESRFGFSAQLRGRGSISPAQSPRSRHGAETETPHRLGRAVACFIEGSDLGPITHVLAPPPRGIAEPRCDAAHCLPGDAKLRSNPQLGDTPAEKTLNPPIALLIHRTHVRIRVGRKNLEIRKPGRCPLL